MNTAEKRWVRLDNAAKIYPASRSRRWSALFRLSATLDEPIDPEILRDAEIRMKKRFPTFFMKLRKGTFWYYLEQTERHPKVREDGPFPCMPMVIDKNRGFSFRVRYYGNRIAAEFFHVLTDGTGGLIFLKTLVAEYLTLKYGCNIPRGGEILDCNVEPDPAETEDSFAVHAGNYAYSPSEKDSYRIRGRKEPDGFVHLTAGKIPVSAILEKSREKKVSLTTYLTAVMITAIESIQDEEHPHRRTQKPVKVCIPVNLRSLFESRTLRNFSNYVNPGIDPRLGDYTFDEILKIVHHFFGTEVTAKLMNAKITANVSMADNPALRIMPLFIKNFAMKIGFLAVGDKKSSTIISNLGNTVLPDEMKKHVTRMDFILGPLLVNRVAFSSLTYDGTLIINVTRTIDDAKLERAFFRKLVELGIPVEIESNSR